uniref:Uncharacterized protein n=1 Tax=Pithovirus LCPAC403 TaxID=2506596 RepID=A0A481ZBM8_9VIRU|nr:MAG: hypothetical protein LCPAC403_00090 [Pithovirus LCPAC403]
MINLGKKWINGNTYGEILKKASKQKDPFKYINKIRDNAIEKIFGEGTFLLRFGVLYNELRFIEITLKYDIVYTSHQKKRFKEIITIEFGVISAVTTILSEPRNFLHALSEEESDILNNLFDYIPYVIQFSALGKNNDENDLLFEIIF